MKNIVKIYLLLSLISSFALTSCQDVVQEQYDMNDLGAFFPFSDGDINVHPLGDEFTVDFTNTLWVCRITHNDGVKFVEPSSKYPNPLTKQYTFKIAPYIYKPGAEERTATIIFSSKDEEKTFTIRQKPAYFNVSVFKNGEEYSESDSLNFDWYKKDDYSIVIDSSIEYVVTINNAEDGASSDFDLKPKPNTQTVGDEISESGSQYQYYVPLKNTSGEREFTISPKKYNISANYNKATMTIKPVLSNADGNGYKGIDSLGFSKKEISMSQDFFIFQIYECPSAIDLKVSDTVKDAVVLDSISELGHTYLTSNEDKTDDNGAKRKIIIAKQKSNVEYKHKLPDNSDEFTIVSESGSYSDSKLHNGRKVEFRVCEIQVLKPNLGDTTLTFDCPPISLVDYEGVNLNVRLNQNPYRFQIVGPNESDSVLTLTSLDSTAQKITINSSGPWELQVGDNSDWLAITGLIDGQDGVYTGEATTKFDVKAEVNTGDSRETNLKLISTFHKEYGVTKEIEFKVKQEAAFVFRPTSDMTSYTLDADPIEFSIEVTKDVEIEAKLTEQADWLGLELIGTKDNDDGKTTTFTYKVTPLSDNKGTESRTCNINITNNFNKEVITIEIEQSAKKEDEK